MPKTPLSTTASPNRKIYNMREIEKLYDNGHLGPTEVLMKINEVIDRINLLSKEDI